MSSLIDQVSLLNIWPLLIRFEAVLWKLGVWYISLISPNWIAIYAKQKPFHLSSQVYVARIFSE